MLCDECGRICDGGSCALCIENEIVLLIQSATNAKWSGPSGAEAAARERLQEIGATHVIVAVGRFRNKEAA